MGQVGWVKRWILRLGVGFFCALLPIVSSFCSEAPQVPILKLLSVKDTYELGASIEVVVQLSLPQGLHTYSNKLQDVGVAPTFSWKCPEGLVAESLIWPSSHIFDVQGVKVDGYDGTITWLARFAADKGMSAGTFPLELTMSFVTCNGQCIPYTQTAETDIILTAPGDAIADLVAIDDESTRVREKGLMENLASISIWNFVLLGFLGGLLLNIMPCVLPVMGLKLVHIISSAKQSYRRSVCSSLAYTAGIVASFLILAGMLLTLQRSGGAFGWGFQLQNPYFDLSLIVLFAFLAANLFGLFECGQNVAAWAQGAEEQVKASYSKNTYTKSFLMGALATIVATPCTGLLLGAVIGFASLLSMTKALLLFTAIGLGMGSPFVLIALMPASSWILPKPGAWMTTFKQSMGFLLLLSILWLIWVLDSVSSSFSYMYLLLGVFVLFVGTWFLGKSQIHLGLFGRVLFFSALFFFLSGGMLAVASCNQSLRSGIHTMLWGQKLDWKSFSNQRLSSALDLGSIVLVKASAKWCVTCQVNELTFANQALRAFLMEKGVVVLEADWTRYNPEITAWLQSVQRNGVPTIALYKKGRLPVVLPELLTPEIVKSGVLALTEEKTS